MSMCMIINQIKNILNQNMHILFILPGHSDVYMNMLMSLCSTVSIYIYTCFLQGDIEKKMGLTPLTTMDRQKADSIPMNQVQFLSVVVMPCVNILSRILISVKPMYHGCR